MAAKLINRPALRYVGSKFRHALWIMPYLPKHTCYVECFSGGMGFLLRKPPSPIEIVNDIDGDVVNFFKVLRDQPKELEDMIQLTPYSREELLTCRRLDLEAATPLERARALYVRAWQGYSGPQAQGNPGWRFDRPPYRGSECMRQFYDTSRLKHIAERLKMVEFENNDARVILKNFDRSETLHFVDPPYYQEHLGEAGDKRYQEVFGEDDHREMAEILRTRVGMVFLTGYHSPLYDELYGEWKQLEKKTTTDHNKHVTEVLWMNKAAEEATPRQSLFFGVDVVDEVEDEYGEEEVAEDLIEASVV